jgi:hypothetical protein
MELPNAYQALIRSALAFLHLSHNNMPLQTRSQYARH